MKFLIAVIVALPLAASAATITVNSTDDLRRAHDGKCTLREAIANVNAGRQTTKGDCTAGSGANDTIAFSLPLPATIVLGVPHGYGTLNIKKNVTIVGPGANLLAIDGAIPKKRIFHIIGGVTASISGLTIQNGYSRAPYRGAQGGGILVDAHAMLDLHDCAMLGNQASTGNNARIGGVGGAIEIAGTATLTNCTLNGNTATSGNGRFGSGGAIFVDSGGSAMLTDCALSGNTAIENGGGIANSGTATLINCTLSGNSTSHSYAFQTGGGGIANSGMATLTTCVLSSNVATDGGGGGKGGGFLNRGTATLSDCMLSNNFGNDGGGGIENGYLSTLTLANCTLSGNSAGFAAGGGIENGYLATLTITNCTLSGNNGIDGGGVGIAIGSTATLSNCTLSSNVAGAGSGGGISNGGVTSLINTIVAMNDPVDCVQGFAGDARLTSNGHNLDGDGTCLVPLVPDPVVNGTDLINTAPMLAPLGSYGGPTQTMALCTGPGTPDPSCTGVTPAIDAGDDSVTGPPDNLATDQRGLPRLAAAHVDIGAYEAQ